MTAGPVLDLRDVFCLHRTGEGDAAALQGLSLELRAGERLCVIGPSGAGKTTLLRVCAGLQAPSAGVVRVFGADLWRMTARARGRVRRAQLGILDQHADRALAPDLTVAQAVALPLALRGVARHTARDRVASLLTACGLADRARARPEQLSGGERQRVALCAALAHRPALLLADEPTAELDAAGAAQLAAMIGALAAAEGTAVLVVSHDAALAAGALRTVQMHDGRIVSERGAGPPLLAVDRGGWVRLPAALRARAGVTAAVSAETDREAIVLRGAGAGPDPVSAEPAAAIRAPAAPVPVSLLALTRRRRDGTGIRTVLDAVTADFAPGQLTAVTGPSGSGKTTLLELIAGHQDADAGIVRVAGADLGGLDAEARADLRRARIGQLSQEPAPAGFLSATENVTLGLALRGRRDAADPVAVRALLAALGLATRADQRAARLSAGEAQRLALAVAVAGSGGLLLADEPTSRLDRVSAGRAIRVLLAAAAAGHTVICATHDPELIAVAAATVALGDAAPAPSPAWRMDGSQPLTTPRRPQ